MEDPQFTAWKLTLTPILYDWFAHHHLQWPTQSCRWGPKFEDLTYKSKNKVYVSEQTDGSEPQKVLVLNAEVCKESVASAEALTNWDEYRLCPYLKPQKAFFHPGEVNKIREVQQHPHLIVTHTDQPDLYLWNADKQPARAHNKKDPGTPADSVAELKLTGHEAIAQFALCTSSAAPHVGSGGTDKLVLTWNLEDHLSAALSSAPCAAAPAEPPALAARSKFVGHTETVEDVVFKPSSSDELVSVGDDKQILFWDARTGGKPTAAVADAHGSGPDIQCVDWSGLQPHLIATGAFDGSLKVWDVRKLAAASSPSSSKDAVHTFKVHSAGIMRVEWYPHAGGVLASGGEDRLIMLWNLDPSYTAGVEMEARSGGGRSGGGGDSSKLPPELMFQHVGHRQGKVVDFQWHASEPYTMLSISDDTNDQEEYGGGTLQMWRINPLIYKPRAEALALLSTHADYIVYGKEKEKAAAKPQAAPAAPAAGSDKPAAAAEMKEEPGTSAAVAEDAAAAAGASAGAEPMDHDHGAAAAAAADAAPAADTQQPEGGGQASAGDYAAT